MRGSVLMLCVGGLWVSGCLPSPPEIEEAPPLQWAPADPAPEVVEEPVTQGRTSEPAHLVVSGGTLQVTLEVGKKEVVLTHAPASGLLTTQDIPTMTYAQGFLLGDAKGWTAGPEIMLGPWVDGVLGDADVPAQIVFELQTIGELSGELLKQGDEATGLVLGTVQIGTRQQPVDVDVRFVRLPGDRIQVMSNRPVPVSLALARRADRLNALASAWGVPKVGETAMVELRLELSVGDDNALPTYQKMPVSITSVQEVKEKLDETVDHYSLEMDRLKRMGVSDQYIRSFSRREFERARRARDKFNRTKKSRY